jgi:hypothetical protein
MATAYPAALDTATQQPSPSPTTDLDAAGYEHATIHTNHSGALIAVETKLGLTDSNATSGAILVGTGASTTAWTTSPAINITGNASGTAATVTGAAQAAITSVGTLGALTVTGAITAGSLVAPLAFNAQTGTTYTFVLADAGKMVTSSNGSAQTVTVPPNSSVAFAIGTQIIVQNIGSANATLAQGSGVTIQSKDSNKEIDGQYAAATLIKTATDTWSLIGALA